MANAEMYLVKVSLCLSVFYVLYLVLFKSTTFFTINRVYLLACLVLSFIIPVLEITLTEHEYQFLPNPTPSMATFTNEHEEDIRQSVTLRNNTVEFTTVIQYIYLLGFTVMLFRFVHSLYKVLKIKNNASSTSIENIKILQTGKLQPFSFFNLIFIPKHEIDPLIIEHEKVHVRQFHWIDLILIELAGLILWFNPIMFLYKKSIKIQHEYLADSCTIVGDVHTEKYLACLLQQIQLENSPGLINSFYSKSIKQRISMITKNKTSFSYATVYVLLIPVICFLLFAFSNKPSRLSISPLNDKESITIIIDAGHGGQDLGFKTKEGLTEKELTLSIAKKIQLLGEEKGIKVVLTRSEDRSLSLKERVMLSNQSDAKVFISIHINYDQYDASKSGMECLVGEKNNLKWEESKAFSQLLVRELQTISGIPMNGIKKSNPMVLQNNGIPAVLLELGYLSNTSDNKFLTNEKNQELIVEKILMSVNKYLN